VIIYKIFNFKFRKQFFTTILTFCSIDIKNDLKIHNFLNVEIIVYKKFSYCSVIINVIIN